MDEFEKYFRNVYKPSNPMMPPEAQRAEAQSQFKTLKNPMRGGEGQGGQTDSRGWQWDQLKKSGTFGPNVKDSAIAGQVIDARNKDAAIGRAKAATNIPDALLGSKSGMRNFIANVGAQNVKDFAPNLGKNEDGSTNLAAPAGALAAERAEEEEKKETPKIKVEEAETPKTEEKKDNDTDKSSLTGIFDEMSGRDKAMLATDAILTSLKNMAKAQPYVGSIYGRSHEAVEPGDEKSMLDNVLSESIKQGLTRRDERGREALRQEMVQKGWPEALQRKAEEILQNNKLSLKQQRDQINQLAGFDRETLQKYAMAQNPMEMAQLKARADAGLWGSMPIIGPYLQNQNLYSNLYGGY